MKTQPGNMSRQGKPRRHRVGIVAYRDLRTFEYCIATEIFALVRPSLGVAWYETIVVSPDRGVLGGIGGVVVKPDAALAALASCDTIVVPGWRDVEAPPPRALLNALRSAHARGARLLSICSGSFVLAATGLLDGRRATTHWMFEDIFRKRFPKVVFEPDVLYVDEGDLITSAGSAAGLDACLHVVRLDFGVAIANMVARRMVVAPHRDGGQAQYVETPVSQTSNRDIGKAMDWARANLSSAFNVADIAARSAMSERTFQRRFRESVGLTPGAWLQRERIAHARGLLESTSLTAEQVAMQSGYETVEAFRAAFRKLVGAPVGAYRSKFSSR